MKKKSKKSKMAKNEKIRVIIKMKINYNNFSFFHLKPIKKNYMVFICCILF